MILHTRYCVKSESYFTGLIQQQENCIAYLSLNVAETRDRVLSFFQGNEIHEVVSCCLSHQRRFKCDTWRNQVTTPVLRVCMLNHYATVPLTVGHRTVIRNLLKDLHSLVQAQLRA